ncbi:MAG TPA: dienelactone hydrolase, partial [Cyanophyceae cyanobacterium]
LPPKLAAWFQVQSIGNQQVAIRLPNLNQFAIAIKSFFTNSTNTVSQANCCTASSLNQVFTDILNNYHQDSTGIS